LVPKTLDDCTGNNFYDVDCIVKLAIKTKKQTFCNVITGQNEVFKWDCLVTVTDDIKTCDSAGEFFTDTCKITYLKNHLKEVA